MIAPIPIMLAPDNISQYRDAIVRAGAVLTDRADAQGLIWSKHGGPDELIALMRTLPNLRWVQLPSAGVDNFVRAGALDPQLAWTSAKGAYAKPVAEHALALTLGLLRVLHLRARAHTWGPQLATTLFGADVTIVGAGGIATELARLLKPFDVRLTVCRRSPEPTGFADRTITLGELRDQLPASDVVVLAAPLSPQTAGLLNREMLHAMKETAVLVNVGRGELVVTDDLVQALARGEIAGAGLDVTDPEPLVDGHPLWSEPRALITPHSADTEAMIIPLLAERIHANVRRFLAAEPLIGAVDPEAGY